MRTYPKLVPFEKRRAGFNALKARVRDKFGDALGLWITDVRYDRYGLYRPGVRKATILIDGDKLASFDLDTVPL